MANDFATSIGRKLSQARVPLSASLVVLFHAIGAAGLATSWRAKFIALSVVNLTVTSALLLWNASPLNRKALSVFSVCAVCGFALEVIGVKTGVIFGLYQYSENLGPRAFEVPLVIGLNWAMLVHASHAIACRFTSRSAHRVILGATLMTLFDYVLEPAAIALNYWQWSGGVIPLRNYMAWWLAAATLILLTEHQVRRTQNPVAPWVIGSQLAFFIVVRSL